MPWLLTIPFLAMSGWLLFFVVGAFGVGWIARGVRK